MHKVKKCVVLSLLWKTESIKFTPIALCDFLVIFWVSKNNFAYILLGPHKVGVGGLLFLFCLFFRVNLFFNSRRKWSGLIIMESVWDYYILCVEKGFDWRHPSKRCPFVWLHSASGSHNNSIFTNSTTAAAQCHLDIDLNQLFTMHFDIFANIVHLTMMII